MYTVKDNKQNIMLNMPYLYSKGEGIVILQNKENNMYKHVLKTFFEKSASGIDLVVTMNNNVFLPKYSTLESVLISLDLEHI